MQIEALEHLDSDDESLSDSLDIEEGEIIEETVHTDTFEMPSDFVFDFERDETGCTDVMLIDVPVVDDQSKSQRKLWLFYVAVKEDDGRKYTLKIDEKELDLSVNFLVFPTELIDNTPVLRLQLPRKYVNDQGEASDANTWFVEQPVVKVFYVDSVYVPNTSRLKGRIISWIYYSKLDLIILKRIDGTQYLRRQVGSFNSLSVADFKALAKIPLINRENVKEAMWFEKWIKSDVWKLEHGEKDLSKFRFHPDQGKMKVLNEIDPWTGKSKIVYKYGKVKSIRWIPLHQWAQDMLRDMEFWMVDRHTGEAVMKTSIAKGDKELLRISDPLQLINFSHVDLKRLVMLPMGCDNILVDEKDRYEKMVRLLLVNHIYPDSVRLFGKDKDVMKDKSPS